MAICNSSERTVGVTTVINLFGGPGIGKSTTALGIAYKMKLSGVDCEYVHEYVKKWAWRGQSVGTFDQAMLFGNQSYNESLIYGKADYIVTDSPVLLCSYYEDHYCDFKIVEPAILAFLQQTKRSGVKHVNFMLTRTFAYKQEGRFEDETEAHKVDQGLQRYLDDLGVEYIKITDDGEDRVQTILNHINK